MCSRNDDPSTYTVASALDNLPFHHLASCNRDHSYTAPCDVGPDECACRGNAKQMREHTKHWCSVMTTDEVNALTELHHV